MPHVQVKLSPTPSHRSSLLSRSSNILPARSKGSKDKSCGEEIMAGRVELASVLVRVVLEILAALAGTPLEAAEGW